VQVLIEARYPDLTPAGVVEGYSRAVLVPRFNGLGAWTIDIPAARLAPEVREAWDARGGITVTDPERPDARPLLAGPLTTDKESWSAQDRYGGTITVAGVSDERILASRIVYPDPGRPWAEQNTSPYHQLGRAPAETVLRGYVSAHAGPGALPARRWPRFALRPDQEQGTPVLGRYRFDVLLEVCQALALAGGIGFRIVQTLTGSLERGLALEVYTPQLRADVLLSAEAGTVTGGTSEITAPGLTAALVAGDGDLTDRALLEQVDPAAELEWGCRVERLVDARQSGDPALLVQDADQALAEGGATGALSVAIVDTPDVQFGRDYELGDVVPYLLRGVDLQDVVREVRITVERGRTSVVPTIGPASADASTSVYKRVQMLERAVRALRAN
jgi:hypothetical protein